VDQATCVTVRRGYSREFVLPVECTQDECPGIFSAVPTGLDLVFKLHRKSGTCWDILSQP
jgi:hypothetical protein